MRKQLPPEMLARDSRFVRTSIMDQVMDPRNQLIGRARPRRSARLQPERPAAGDRARNLMHGIFIGEIQALEGAGRTTFDFDDDDRRRSRSSSTWPASAGTRAATSRSR